MLIRYLPWPVRELLVMRHAKSDWAAAYGADHDRPLNDRGVRSARLMGRVLTAESLVPDLIVSSSAVRALTTANIAAEAGGWSVDIGVDPTLYSSGVDAVLEILGNAPAVNRLMIVGHQPTWSMLVAELTGARVDMKTGTVAVIDRDENRLTRVIQPRDHFGTEYDG